MSEIQFEKPIKAETTNIPGMLVFDLAVHGDSRGWFKENWQRAKQTALGLPDLGPVQNNISFNASKGVTRGIHAEPWDKYISVATGSVFGSWVDLRPGKSFGQVYSCVIDPSKSIYVPRGVGNSFQALEDGTAYTYLVNAHWSAELKKTYTFVNLDDPELDIQWPIPLDECELSEADKAHPMLKDAIPMAPRRTLVTGANGQLGRAVRELAGERDLLASFDFTDRDVFDFSDASEYPKIDWTLYGAVINCGAYTAVDAAEAPEGRKAAWVGRQCPGPGAARESLRGTWHNARARVQRLRVRRNGRGTHRGRAFLTAGRLRPDQGGRRHRGRQLPQTLHRALQLGDRRRQELRQDDGGALRPLCRPR